MNMSYFYDQIYHDAPDLFATTLTPGSPVTKVTIKVMRGEYFSQE